MRKLYSAFFTLIIGLCCTLQAYAYPNVTIKNNTEYTVKGKVKYMACSTDDYSVKPGKTWTGPNRGACLLTDISGSLSGTPKSLQGTNKTSYGEKLSVTSYDSTGTAYAQFQINAFGDRYRIFSLAESEKVKNTDPRKSPGFRMVNETPWPIAVSFDQVGCLYYGIVPAKHNGTPGVLVRDTGAVWFTIRAHIQPDGRNVQTDFDCIKPVAELIGEIGFSVMTGGLTGTGMALAKQIAKEAIKETAIQVVQLGVQQLGNYLTQTSSIEMFGQYAGYAWPFQCDEMPEYTISGGPIPYIDNNGNAVIAQGERFKIAKTNSCGNDMMLGSVKSKSIDAFPPGSNPAPPSPNPVKFIYNITIDCNHGDLKSEGTKGNITASLMAGRTMLGTKVFRSPSCSGQGVLDFEVAASSASAKSLTLTTDSDNAFFIDAIAISLNGIVIKKHGKNGGRGWCLSTDLNDVNGSWKNYISNCERTKLYTLK